MVLMSLRGDIVPVFASMMNMVGNLLNLTIFTDPEVQLWQVLLGGIGFSWLFSWLSVSFGGGVGIDDDPEYESVYDWDMEDDIEEGFFENSRDRWYDDWDD